MPAVRSGSVPGAGPGGWRGSALERAAGRAWRLLVVAVAGYAGYLLVSRLILPVVAVFVALVITAVLRPPVDLLARRMPRALAVLLTLLGALLLIAGLALLAVLVVRAQTDQLGGQVRDGVDRLEQWLEGPPLHAAPGTLTDLRQRLGDLISTHRQAVLSTALTSAGWLVEAVAALALALFCAVFLTHSGERMWHWATDLLPSRNASRWNRAGHAAWRTFAGYTRGLFLVAGTNAVLVGVMLAVLGVPLAVPLAGLEFLAALIPLVGSPIALAVASLVALATRGPVTALLVLALIVVIGQLEGHVLHPLVMSWAVRLHPVAVALAVAVGGTLGGIVGAAVAVPVLSVGWAVFRELRDGDGQGGDVRGGDGRSGAGRGGDGPSGAGRGGGKGPDGASPGRSPDRH
ncbi:AI-2E family transporter [Kitasatospora sp. NA04385]|uniref:AI-2E family transporter n=1 Tax=Kitasatospora sp. NA04385 TaxID=2742135 RepID=UPI0020CB08AF|nr:AI-2E family transporter [Kitasatospora sp. NA04385]